jgi:hypothetical protein
MPDNERIVSYKAIFWFVKYAMAIGLIPSLFLLLSLQIKLAIVSYSTLGLFIGIWSVHKAFGAQMVVFDNLGIKRKTLYFYTAGCHFAISAIAFLSVYIPGI